jgi:NAD(P)-dependent dehydrogenase (short-subunit alcohol dehydrogenase family)
LQDLFSIQDRVAVVTGGSGVLAGTMIDYLGKHGVRIGLLDYKAERARARVAELQEAGIEATPLVADVLELPQLEAAAARIREQYGRLDILINAAGGNRPGATIGPQESIFDLSPEDFRAVSALNLEGSLLPTLAFGRLLTEQGHGSIINISSMASGPAITRVLGYSVAKAGIDQFTRWLAVELATKFGEGLRVNAIAPGFFIGNQNRRLLLNEDGSLTARGETIIRNTPMRRFGEAEELCGVLHLLCSDASKFMTGTVIPVDGGFSAFSGV